MSTLSSHYRNAAHVGNVYDRHDTDGICAPPRGTRHQPRSVSNGSFPQIKRSEKWVNIDGDWFVDEFLRVVRAGVRKPGKWIPGGRCLGWAKVRVVNQCQVERRVWVEARPPYGRALGQISVDMDLLETGDSPPRKVDPVGDRARRLAQARRRQLATHGLVKVEHPACPACYGTGHVWRLAPSGDIDIAQINNPAGSCTRCLGTGHAYRRATLPHPSTLKRSER